MYKFGWYQHFLVTQLKIRGSNVTEKDQNPMKFRSFVKLNLQIVVYSVFTGDIRIHRTVYMCVYMSQVPRITFRFDSNVTGCTTNRNLTIWLLFFLFASAIRGQHKNRKKRKKIFDKHIRALLCILKSISSCLFSTFTMRSNQCTMYNDILALDLLRQLVHVSQEIFIAFFKHVSMFTLAVYTTATWYK